ncbi:MAG: hypothetical protein FJ025_05685, partial [Chloroflexi bacterium]|nr:hypothetical protein [Chloroflexota bacterium]
MSQLDSMLDWLKENWLAIVWPLLAFVAAYVVGLWLRRVVFRALERWEAVARWEGSPIIARVTRTPFLVWFLILGAYVAIYVSGLETPLKALIGKVLVSIFIISLTWVLARLAEKLLRLYIGKVERLKASEPLLVNIAKIIVFVFGALVLLDYLGAPITPLVLLLAVGVLVVALVFRDLLA